MNVLGQMRDHKETWTKGFEHGILRLVSFVFSIVSAHAIRWIFSPLDTAVGADTLQPFITWSAAAGFGILGYFVSRGLAYRMMRNEKYWSYIPICLVVELVEIFANYAQAAAVIQNATWIHSAPINQQGALVFVTYIMLSIVPLASLFLAVVDMDLERNKDKVPHGAVVSTLPKGNGVVPGLPKGNGFVPPVVNAAASRQYGAPALAGQRGASPANPTPGVRTQAAPASTAWGPTPIQPAVTP